MLKSFLKLLLAFAPWTMRHMGVLANGALAIGTWAAIATGRAFTLEYAKAQTDPAVWDDHAFRRVNLLITMVWAAVFTANALLAWAKMDNAMLPTWAFEALSYVLLAGAAAFTAWYPERVRAHRAWPGGRTSR